MPTLETEKLITLAPERRSAFAAPQGEPHGSESQWAVLAGLRFLLALSVLVSHMSQFLTYPRDPAKMFAPFGCLPAVMAFFVVSGYSISASIERDKGRFYQRRIARIYPVYLVGLALGFLPFLVFGPAVPWGATDHAHWTGGLMHNMPIGMYVKDLLFLQAFNSAPPPFNGPLWSLGVEAVLYAVAPLLLFATPKVVWAALAVSAMIYMLEGPLALLSGAFPGNQIVQFAWLWLLGWQMQRSSDVRKLYPVALLLAVFLACYSVSTIATSGAFSVALAVTALAYGDRIHLTRETSNLLLYLGDLSYPLYCIHYPIMVTLYNQSYQETSPLYLSVILLASVVVLHLIDRPARRWINTLRLTGLSVHKGRESDSDLRPA